MVLSEICVLVFVVRWYLTADALITEHVLIVWALISVGYAFCVSFFAFGLWGVEWRWIVVIPALMVALGNVMFIRYIEGFSGQAKVSLMLVLAALAALPILLS